MLPRVIFLETVSRLMSIKRPSHTVESLYRSLRTVEYIYHSDI